MKSLALVHTSWLKPFADYFATKGVTLAPYYEKSKIEALQVEAGEGWITKHQLYKFLNGAAKGESMPELGFVVGETIKPTSLGAISKAMGGARTLGQAIRIFCQLINRHSEENRAWLEEGDDGQLWLLDQTTNPFKADRRIADHAGLMTLVNLVRLAAAEDWYPREVMLQTAATRSIARIPGLRETNISFRQHATGLAFPPRWLFTTIDLNLDARESAASSEPDGLLEKNESTVTRIKHLIREILGVGGMAPGVTLMAELCHTSARTLHRRLLESGATYQQLLDGVRLEEAKKKLKRSSITVQELATDLGFSGANNFIRAFRRMEGMTPNEFRQRVK